MADLNQGTRQRNLRHLSGSAAVPSGNLRETSNGIPRGTPTDIIQALGGHIGGWWIENRRLTADGGNAKIDANVPSISLGAAIDFLTGAGIWFGKDSTVYKARIGDPEGNHLKWDGSTLAVVGTITAEAGEIGGWTIDGSSIWADDTLVLLDAATPKITLGDATDYLVGAGFFVGKSGGAYKLRIGDPEGNWLKWDGSTGALTLNGTVTTNSLNPALQSFTTSIVFSSTDNDTVSWTAGTIRLASGMTYSILAGNTGDMTALTYIYLDTSVSLTALQTTTVYSNAVGDNRLLLAAAQNHAVGASVIPYTGQQPIINGTDQITAQSVVAANIAAGAVTADKISVTNLSAISANLGSITAGTITGGLIRTAASGARVQIDATSLAGYGTDGVTKQFYLDANDGKAYAGGGNITLDNNGITMAAQSSYNTSTALKWKYGATELARVYAIYTGSSPRVGHISLEPLDSNGDVTNTTVSLIADFVYLSGNSVIVPAGGTLSVAGGINVGTATGAAPGQIKTTGNAYVGGTLSVGGNTLGATYYPLFAPGTVWNNLNINDGTWNYNATSYGVPSGATAIVARVSCNSSGALLHVRRYGDAFDDIYINGVNGQTVQAIVRLNANLFTIAVTGGWLYGWVFIIGYFK